jgi:hypothetical protein
MLQAERGLAGTEADARRFLDACFANAGSAPVHPPAASLTHPTGPSHLGHREFQAADRIF